MSPIKPSDQARGGRGRKVFVCSSCGYQSPRWLGRCPDCACWNTLTEEAVASGGAAAYPAAAPPSVLLDDLAVSQEERLPTGIDELDRVLGGGLVIGSLVLVGGEPGIGKSTLLLQALLTLSAAGIPALLVSGEESPAQVKMRAGRLGAGISGLRLLPETQIEKVTAALERDRPEVCVIDSVQTLWTPAASGAPGSVSQIREVTGHLLRMAKTEGITVVIVGHVTKDGFLAGPRVLEHMVDAVLAFEGDRGHPYRLLRAVKNRFGSTNEVGVFQMTGSGLEGVPDPTALFLDESRRDSGAVVAAVVEGTRCLLAEMQALVVPSGLAVPRRVGRGVDRNRLAMVTAVLTRKAGLRLSDQDLFVNVAGGLTVEDPGADAALAAAVASSLRDAPLPEDAAVFGEISLTGHLRYVTQGPKRLQELSRRGFRRVFLPERNLQEAREQSILPSELSAVPVVDVRDLLGVVFG